MIADEQTTIIEDVRMFKEANAAKHDFNIARIIDSAQKRQEESGRRIIRQGEQDTAPNEKQRDKPAVS